MKFKALVPILSLLLFWQIGVRGPVVENAEAKTYVCERPIPSSYGLRYVSGAKEYVFSKDPCPGSKPRLIPKNPVSIVVPTAPKKHVKRFVVHFRFADATLSDEAKRILLRVVEEGLNAKRIKIRGCTCWITKIKGGNERVARKRARTVAEFLVSHGIPRNKLKVTWSPHCPYVDTENPAPNRRVEVEIE